MHVLPTGATGYIGKRLLQSLLQRGYSVTCCVRNRQRFTPPVGFDDQLEVLETDFNEPLVPPSNLKPVSVAYYLIHSLSESTEGIAQSELNTARHFRLLAESLQCEQVIYLGGIAHENHLSEHLASRKGVEEELKKGAFKTTILRAAIIVGSGSASFEIIRDLVEKIPVMVTPRWVNTLCQPISIRNVIDYLLGVIQNEKTYNETFDIGGPEVLSYKQMMLDFGSVRGLKRLIYTLPVMTPRLSSYWLYFITSTNYKLAVNLVKSMKVEVVCRDNRLQDILQIELISYKDAVQNAFGKIEQNMVVSSWNDALSSSGKEQNWNQHIRVPSQGCFIDNRTFRLGDTQETVLKRLWQIGGKKGWYYASWLWKIRGFLDRLVGGVGLRRGRTNALQIHPGDALDFWRVLVADPGKGRLLLYAEMKLPGEAWLEFNIRSQENGQDILVQQATFRPRGLTGRLYWYSVSPFHAFLFEGMGRKIAG
ncbi:SDR family oxidoreductase [bacterium SCSIO 12741]|nr:SDR family oxidoreductase [bacterium SCSIO 12741]